MTLQWFFDFPQISAPFQILHGIDTLFFRMHSFNFAVMLFFWLPKNHYSFLSLQANRRSSSYFLYFNCQAPDSGLTFSNPQLRTTPRTKIPCWYMCGQEDNSPLLQQQNTWYCQEKNLNLCQWSRQMSKLQCGYKALSYMSHSLLMWPYWIC